MGDGNDSHILLPYRCAYTDNKQIIFRELNCTDGGNFARGNNAQ